MKIKATSETDTYPVKIELTIESHDEIVELWHRLNLSPSVLQGQDKYDQGRKKNFSKFSCFTFLSVVDSIIKKIHS